MESKYAVEGTRAHECLEAFLKNAPEKGAAVETSLLKKYPHEMVDYAYAAALEIRVMTPKGATLLSESRCDLSHISPDMWGTTDAAIVENFGRLTVVDFKYGAGVAVDPENNSQMAFYALGIAHRYDYNFADVALVIVQPRADHPSGKTTREWVISIDELIAWGDKFKAGVEACQDDFAPLVAGKWCKFCRAKPICPAISDQAMEQARLDFEDGALVKPPLLSVLDIESALAAASMLEDWIGAVREQALARLEKGEQIPGWKLVAKRGQRQWKDEESAAMEARMVWADEAFTEPKLLSPAQFEKTIVKSRGETAKKWLDVNAETVSSGNTLAPATDKRPEVGSIDVDFADVIPLPPQKMTITDKTVVKTSSGKLKTIKQIKTELHETVARKPPRKAVRAMPKYRTKATKAKRKR